MLKISTVKLINKGHPYCRSFVTTIEGFYLVKKITGLHSCHLALIQGLALVLEGHYWGVLLYCIIPNNCPLPIGNNSSCTPACNFALLLCRTMACFQVISTSLISGGDHPCAHYFLWILPLCALPLCSMTHYDITMGHDIVRNAPLWNNNGQWRC